MEKLLLSVFIVFFSVTIFAQLTWVSVIPDSSHPNAAWEVGYKQRKEFLLNSSTWTGRSSRGDTDNGKRYWTLLLGDMYLNRGSQTAIDALILDGSRGGHSGIYGTYEGSFYKPFSCPGYAFYYFTYYDRITVVDTVQHTKVQTMWNNPNRGFASRIDGKMDPIYLCNEFNSENFDWMERIGGYLMSHHFNDNTNITDGNKPAMQYYENWVNNWVRATYSAGRVEWNSHVYFVYCFQAAASLSQFATDSMTRLRGRAVQDWMAMELALHYMDGQQVGPESRNKGGGYKVFDNDVIGYEYLWFTDNANKVSTCIDDSVRHIYSGDLHTSGYIANMAYRPPQVIIDIAQRKFNLPVEMHNVKPFYRLDYENFKNWNGKSGTNGRRFEFETSYFNTNYTLSSLAGGRPKGVDCFSEQCLWRFGVKDRYYQVFGNSGSMSGIAGRCEFEQIGQYRNTMMRVIKGTNNMWVAVANEVTDKAFDGNILFADMGNGVYMAVRPYNATANSSAAYTPGTGDNYTKYTWNFSTSAIGALILEVGTVAEHTSFANFKTLVKAASLTSPSATQVQYVSTLGRKLKVEHMGTTSYSYTSNSCGTLVINPSGKYPRVWYDDVETDFNTWNLYEVVYGDKIVDNKWGSGFLHLKSNNNELKITIDTTTANVKYEMLKMLTSNKPIIETKKAVVNSFEVFPNPTLGEVTLNISSEKNQTSVINVYDLLGRKVLELFKGSIESGEKQVSANLSKLPKGLYFILFDGSEWDRSKRISLE